MQQTGGPKMGTAFETDNIKRSSSLSSTLVLEIIPNFSWKSLSYLWLTTSARLDRYCPPDPRCPHPPSRSPHLPRTVMTRLLSGLGNNSGAALFWNKVALVPSSVLLICLPPLLLQEQRARRPRSAGGARRGGVLQRTTPVDEADLHSARDTPPRTTEPSRLAASASSLSRLKLNGFHGLQQQRFSKIRATSSESGLFCCHTGREKVRLRYGRVCPSTLLQTPADCFDTAS